MGIKVIHEKESSKTVKCPSCSSPMFSNDLRKSYFCSIFLDNKTHIYGYSDLLTQSFSPKSGSFNKELVWLCSNCVFACSFYVFDKLTIRNR